MTDIGYYEGSDLFPLPAWAHYFIDVGAAIASEATDDRLVRIGLSLPTLAHAAAFVALGFTTARARASTPRLSKKQHLQSLMELPEGAPVSLRRGNRGLKGIFVGAEWLGDVLTFGVRVHSKDGDALTKYVRSDEAHRIQPLSGPVGRLPKKQKGRPVVRHASFLQGFLPDVDPVNYARSGRVECVVLGQVKRFYRETVQTKLGFSVGADFHMGTLQDVLRVERFTTDGSSPRCQVIAGGRNRRPSPSAAHRRATIVVLDGSLPYTYWRDEWNGTSSVAVLDRTDTLFDEAQAHEQRSWSKQGRKGLLSRQGLQAPAGVEILCDREVER